MTLYLTDVEPDVAQFMLRYWNNAFITTDGMPSSQYCYVGIPDIKSFTVNRNEDILIEQMKGSMGIVKRLDYQQVVLK